MTNVIKKINVDGVEYDIQGKELTKVTYAELKELRDNGELVEGHLYRITDYEFTTVQVDTKSAGHVFDIIVPATSANELSHIARAIAHEGDTYFDDNDLGAWELWYDLDNDTTKYAWADAENGKGIIYRMIDEKRNDCPYDFKNALFYNGRLSYPVTEDRYYYTFSYFVGSLLYDGTVEKRMTNCYGNSMVVYRSPNRRFLNRNVLRIDDNCYGNTFGINCSDNTFEGSNCYGNTFSRNCSNNTFEHHCYNNTFGINCSNNTFEHHCYNNILGNGCSNNTLLENCSNNTFGINCSNNTFGINCYNNILGNGCSNNTFGINCYGNILGNMVIQYTINRREVSIVLDDEYYDDGSGQLVPVKHPDLSTQPSILPYKFMGNYVYEQLIPIGEADSLESLTSTGVDLTSVLAPNTVILELNGFANVKVVNLLNFKSHVVGVPLKAKSLHVNGSFNFELNVESGLTPEENDGMITYGKVVSAYVHVVYTSMAEDSSYYGGEVSDGLSLPSTGYIFAIPQDYGVLGVLHIDTLSNPTYGTLIGTSTGYDYWHVDWNLQKNSSDSFSIIRDDGAMVNRLKAEVYKDFSTNVTNLVAWGQNAGDGTYYVSKADIPNYEEMTSLFVKIL